MSEDDHFISWSLSGYYFVCCMLLFNVIFFSVILSTSKYREEIYTNNKFALVVLIEIILISLVRAFLMDSFLFGFNDACHADHENCTRCTISGYCVYYLASFGIIAMLLMILKTTENTFQPFPVLAYSDSFILKLKILVIVLFATIFIVKETLLPLKYRVYELEADPSIHVCIQSFDKETVSNYQAIVVLFTGPFFGSYTLFCVLFIRKSMQLYKFTARKIDPHKIDDGLKKLQRIMRPTVRHTLLVVLMAISLFLLTSVNRSLNPDGIPLTSVDSFLLGMAIVMMFPFGIRCFNIFCGCFERCIINRWIDMAIKSNNAKIKNESMSSLKSTPSEIKDNTTDTEAKLTKSRLPTIEEDSASFPFSETNRTRSDEKLPSLPEFRSIEISMECERLQGITSQDRSNQIKAFSPMSY